MSEVDPLALMLTTVNAPYRDQLVASELAACLADLELAKRHSGHVSSFLGEVPVALQVEFALAHGLAPHRLPPLPSSFQNGLVKPIPWPSDLRMAVALCVPIERGVAQGVLV